MISPDFIHALLEAVNPRWRCNRRRLRSRWSQWIVNFIALCCSAIKGMPGFCRRMFRIFIPKGPEYMYGSDGSKNRFIRSKRKRLRSLRNPVRPDRIYRLDCTTRHDLPTMARHPLS